MSDIYVHITSAETGALENLARVLELRADDPQQIAMRTSYQSEIELYSGAIILEVGCGTGPVSRALATSGALDLPFATSAAMATMAS